MPTPHWDLGALLLAIVMVPLVMSPSGARLLQLIASYSLGFIWPDIGWCDSFCWSDIQDGLIHLCMANGQCTTGNQSPPQGTKKCWEQLFSTQFNRSWGARAKARARKPTQLLFSGRYLLTDTRTLLTCLLLSSGESSSCVISDDTYDFVLGKTKLEMFLCGDILCAHIHGPSRACQKRMTKKECQNILLGYPPCYRERVVTSQGHTFDYPDQMDGWMKRGGWIIVLGLGQVFPLKVYVDRGMDYRDACYRIRDICADDIQAAIPDRFKAGLRKPLEVVRKMCEQQSGSGIPNELKGTELNDACNYGMYTSGFTKEDCIFAVNLFNRKGPLTAQEIATLEPILDGVLAAAIRGMFHLLDYLKNVGGPMNRRVELLFQKNQKVFLKDCIH